MGVQQHLSCDAHQANRLVTWLVPEEVLCIPAETSESRSQVVLGKSREETDGIEEVRLAGRVRSQDRQEGPEIYRKVLERLEAVDLDAREQVHLPFGWIRSHTVGLSQPAAHPRQQ